MRWTASRKCECPHLIRHGFAVPPSPHRGRQRGAQTFADVQESDWFYDAVCYVTDNGLMNGTGSGFAPQQTTSRAMLWAVLSRVDGQNANDWYAAAQLWAIQHDISDGTVPEAPITREQLAAMLYRYAQRKGLVRAASYADLSGFADAASVSAYADEAMQWAVANGILTGMGGKLCPQGNATRAQVAQILYRLCEKWDLLPADNTAAIASAIYFAENPEHTHVWGEAKPNGNGTHTSTCACGETKTEYCGFPKETGTVTCPTCGFTTDHGVKNYGDLVQAIQDGQKEIFITDDIEMEAELVTLNDTIIHGDGHTLTLAESNTTQRMFDAGSHTLTLENLELDGESENYSGHKGVLNSEAKGSLILKNVVIQNFKAERIIRAWCSKEVSLTDVTIRNNELKTKDDFSCLFLLTGVMKATMKNVSITGNHGDNNLITIWNEMALDAENLTIEDNQVTGHILGTSGTMHTGSITLESGAIKENSSNTNGFFMVGDLTIGQDMTVECNIVINNDRNNGVCTLTNNGLIVGDIKTVFPDRGLPNYTGSGTHTGKKTDIHDLTVKP